MTNGQEFYSNDSHKSFRGFITTLLSESILDNGFEPLEKEDLELCKIEDDSLFVHRFVTPLKLK